MANAFGGGGGHWLCACRQKQYMICYCKFYWLDHIRHQEVKAIFITILTIHTGIFRSVVHWVKFQSMHM